MSFIKNAFNDALITATPGEYSRNSVNLTSRADLASGIFAGANNISIQNTRA